MKKYLIIIALSFTGLSSAQSLPSEDLLLLNGTPVSIDMAITLHGRFDSFYPIIEYVYVTVGSLNNVWLFNGQPGIPYSSIANYTDPLIVHYGPGNYGFVYAPIPQDSLALKTKWNYIKTDLGANCDIPDLGWLFKITPFYDSSLGAYTPIGPGGVVKLNTSPNEVYMLENYFSGMYYNDGPFPASDCLVGAESGDYEIISSPSPFGGYIVSFNFYPHP